MMPKMMKLLLNDPTTPLTTAAIINHEERNHSANAGGCRGLSRQV